MVARRLSTRRDLLSGAIGLSVLALTANSTRAHESTPAASPASRGEWSFTDDKGVTVTLPDMPQRIAADVNAAAPLWDFGIRPVAVFGWNATETGDFGPAGGNVDPAQVEVVGTAAETIMVEPLVAVEPDLIVTITWAPDDPNEYWSIDPELVDDVERTAPIVAIAGTGSADVNTERFAELAASLGDDLESDELVAAKARYEAALADFTEVASSKSDLSILFTYVNPAEQVYYVATARDWADLTFYASLGLSIVDPDVDAGSYWEELSMEEAIKYPADVFFNSTRPGNLTAEELQTHPTFGLHPAVQAGQIGGWNQDFIMSYQGMAEALETTAAVIADAEKII
jgi:iron complex transport system substrate-binding protein